MERLSLCMILKDEEELLPRFLERARGLWDELVAVDTGSSDATPRLLAEAGARVIHRPWTGDFAAARNASLDLAAGEWVAVLDADEMVDPALIAGARALLGDAGAGAATVRLLNRLPHGHVRESRLLRLFRRAPSVRFRHAIHEEAVDDVLAELRRTGRRLVHLPGSIEHLGYVRERAAARSKKERDVGILEACLRVDPLDLYGHFKRLEQARFWGDRPLWRRAAIDARSAMERAPDRLAGAHYGGELAVLVADGVAEGTPSAALALLDGWARRLDPCAAFHLRRGELAEALGQVGRAAAEFAACLALEPTTANRQLATVRPRLGLARLALARQDVASALAEVDRALKLAPHDPEALLAAAALHRARGGAAAVLAFAAAHAASHGDAPELHQAVGESALLAGDAGLAVTALARAAGEPPAGPAAPPLARALLAAGEVGAARRLAARLAAEQPEAGLVAVCCDLVEGREVEVEIDLTPEEADRALRQVVAAVRAAGAPAVLGALRRAAPALAESFPWLAGALGR